MLSYVKIEKLVFLEGYVEQAKLQAEESFPGGKSSAYYRGQADICSMILKRIRAITDHDREES